MPDGYAALETALLLKPAPGSADEALLGAPIDEGTWQAMQAAYVKLDAIRAESEKVALAASGMYYGNAATEIATLAYKVGLVLQADLAFHRSGAAKDE